MNQIVPAVGQPCCVFGAFCVENRLSQASSPRWLTAVRRCVGICALTMFTSEIFNAEVLFREDCSPDEFIDVIVGNRVYMPCLYVSISETACLLPHQVLCWRKHCVCLVPKAVTIQQGAFYKLYSCGCALCVFPVPSCGWLPWSRTSCVSWWHWVCSHGVEPPVPVLQAPHLGFHSWSLVPEVTYWRYLIVTGSIVKSKMLKNVLQVFPKGQL